MLINFANRMALRDICLWYAWYNRLVRFLCIDYSNRKSVSWHKRYFMIVLNTYIMYILYNYCSLYHMVEIHSTGIGLGMIKTSFFVLLSTLFLLNRHTAHLTDHLGSFTGMLIVPSLTEFVMLTYDWYAALYLHFGSCS